MRLLLYKLPTIVLCGPITVPFFWQKVHTNGTNWMENILKVQTTLLCKDISARWIMIGVEVKVKVR